MEGILRCAGVVTSGIALAVIVGRKWGAIGLAWLSALEFIAVLSSIGGY